jgi:diguanylate cyclase (GGDEF)-like protein
MKVLIVDDQRSIRMLSLMVVESLGHEVVEASCGQEAIDICSAQKVDLILMDVEMPGINGFETTKLIRENNDIWFPIIFVSAKTDPKFFSEGIKSGGDIYLFKPIVPEVLESMIHAMERIASIQEELHGTKTKMELLAHQDTLTGAVNRRGFDKAMELEINHAQKEKSPLTLMMIDVDKFKPFNDHYGHQAGDECLKAVSKALHKAICRPSDIVTRYGGEEFAVILPNTTAKQAEVVGGRIVAEFKSLAFPHEYSDTEAHVTVSGGIAEIEKGQTANELVKLADDGLYQAKENGRNQFVVKR